MNCSYVRDMSHNYMVPEPAQEVDTEDYQLHMLTENKIRGFLPCTLKNRNGSYGIYYDITSRQAMNHIYRKNSMGERELHLFFKGLLTAMQEAQKYLLDISKLSLEPEMIYLDVETGEPMFCYFPGWRQDWEKSFGNLTAYILECIRQQDFRAVLLGYELYRGAREENANMEALLKGAVQKSGEMYDYASGAASWEYPETGENNGELSGVWRASCPPRTEGSRQAFIGKRETQEQRRDLAVQSAQEKGGGKIRSSAVQAENRAWDEKEMEENGQKETDQQEEQRKAKRRGEKGQKEKRQREKQEKPAQRQKKKTKGGGFLVAALALAVVLTAAGAWLWGLNTTQIGGVVFLLIGVLGYGCSLERRKKKDSKGRKKKGEEKRPYMIKDQEEIKEAPDGFPAARQQEELETWRKEDDSRNGFCQERQPQRRQKAHMGNTINFWEGGESGGLSLISRNLSSPQSILLEKEQYLIGKMGSMADIVLKYPSISRVHAKIQREGENYYISDMNSTNGTFVNGRRLGICEKAAIHLGDEVAFAGAAFYLGRDIVEGDW